MYVQAMKERKSRSQSPSVSPTPPSPPTQPVKRQAPPKPPRGSTLIEDDVFQQDDALVIRKVDSIVDMDARDLYHSYHKINRADREKEGRVEGGGGGREEGGGEGGGGRESPFLQRQRQPLHRQLSFSSDDWRGGRRHVTSLVELFEGGKTPAIMTGFPPSTTHSKHQIPDCPVRGNSAPSIPPRPAQPPRPPRFMGGGSGDPPAIPPHTPAPRW